MNSNDNKEPLKPLGLNLGIILQKNPNTPDYEELLKNLNTLQASVKDISAEIKSITEKIDCTNSNLAEAIKNELNGLKKTIIDINITNNNIHECTGKMWNINFDYRERGWTLCPCLKDVRTASAIVLDLNCDGEPAVTGKNIFGDKKVSGPTVKFNIDPSLVSGKDQRERTEWIVADSGSGFLVWDIDLDGKITSSKELFGNFDIDGEIKFEDGYQKLSSYFDKNKDGMITGTELADLMIWTDNNADGITQPEELKSLSEFGITCLDIRNINGLDKSAVFKYIC